MRDKAIESCKILNQFIGDLVAATYALELFEFQGYPSNLNCEMKLSLRRMCVSYLIITLSKLCEVYERYKGVMPKDIKGNVKTLYKEIDNRGITKFRNFVIGHIWHKRFRRPLLTNETEELLKKVYPDLRSFIKWVNDSKNNKFPNTVTSICEHLRNRIMQEYQLKAGEVLK